jgi:hypothetical protein
VRIRGAHGRVRQGNQWSSDSSSEMYRRVLAMGCRCVELDCFDGVDGELPRLTQSTHVHCVQCTVRTDGAALCERQVSR